MERRFFPVSSPHFETAVQQNQGLKRQDETICMGFPSKYDYGHGHKRMVASVSPRAS